jgi:hypothetical protein
VTSSGNMFGELCFCINENTNISLKEIKATIKRRTWASIYELGITSFYEISEDIAKMLFDKYDIIYKEEEK